MIYKLVYTNLFNFDCETSTFYLHGM